MIPLAEPCLNGKETEYVKQAIDSGWVSGAGEFVERFESMVARATGRSWCVATLTGTAAIHLALAAIGTVAGDLVKLRSYTFIGAANAASYLGARPYFEDLEDDWTPDRSWVGGVVDAAADIARLREAGGEPACLSFNGNKTITTGQGGAIVGDSADLESTVRYLANVAKSGPYEHNKIGFNYRMPNLNAALGCAQMERLDEFRERKKNIVGRYREAGFQLLDSSWMALWRTRDARKKLNLLRDSGIDARPFWKPLHLQVPYYHCQHEPLPRTDALWHEIVCLPCSVGLSVVDQDRIIAACEKYL